jgi:hypothetical protein
MKSRLIALLALLGVTLLGFQVAYWTDWDKLPRRKIFSAPINFTAHIFVLSSWTLAWLYFWKQFFGQRTRGLALAVCILAAITAELLQNFLHGHRPDWIGFGYNIAGVALGACLFERFFGPEKVFAVVRNDTNCTN